MDINMRTWQEVNPEGENPLPSSFVTCVCEWDEDTEQLDLYIFGGIDTNDFSNKIYSLNWNTKVWTSWPVLSGTPPYGRVTAGATVWNGAMYVFGGDGTLFGEGLRPEDTNIYRYSFLNKSWSILETTGVPEKQHRAYFGTA